MDGELGGVFQGHRHGALVVKAIARHLFCLFTSVVALAAPVISGPQVFRGSATGPGECI